MAQIAIPMLLGRSGWLSEFTSRSFRIEFAGLLLRNLIKSETIPYTIYPEYGNLN